MPSFIKQLEAVQESNTDQAITSLIANCKRLHITDPVMVARYGIRHNKNLKKLGYMTIKELIIKEVIK